MKIEIAVEGPFDALRTLSRRTKAPFSFPRGRNPLGVVGEERGWMVLEEEEEALENRLLAISSAARGLERELRLTEGFRFRVRNTAYSEPPPGSDRFRAPFRPIPSITVQPWYPSMNDLPRSGSILIDCRQAFGTGNHPTTRLCLQALEGAVRTTASGRGVHGARVLDFGCGTGLLAIAAVRMGFPSALGVDLDPDSAWTAGRNVRLNGLEGRVRIVNGSLGSVRGCFQLILANLVPSVLLRAGAALPDRLGPGGTAVISGFGVQGVETIEGFFAERGLLPGKRLVLGDWACLVMAKAEEGRG